MDDRRHRCDRWRRRVANWFEKEVRPKLGKITRMCESGCYSVQVDPTNPLNLGQNSGPCD